ncbi:MAG: cyclodeaminase/cyclohydrolase family protein [Candidatus Limnocylindria bacterium]
METRLSEMTVRTLVERMATSDPVPGGGSAAALAGAMGAALVQMVVALTVARPSEEGNETTLTDLRTAAAAWQSELINLSELDANAYEAVVRARKLPRESQRERDARSVHISAAMREATRIPLATARAASAVLDLAGQVAPIGNRNAISDVGVAGILATTSLRGAALNVEINLPHLTSDEELRNKAAAEIASLLATVDERDLAVRTAVAERLR